MIGNKTHENIISEAAQATESQDASVTLGDGHALPATFTNRYTVRVWGGMVRVEFGEVVYNGPDVFHHAVQMQMGNAEELAQLILSLIADNKAQNPDGR